MGCGLSGSKKDKEDRYSITTSSAPSPRKAESNEPFLIGSTTQPGYLFSRLRQAQQLKEVQLDSACVILKQTFDRGISRLDQVNEHDYNVVTMLLEHMRDALAEWTHAKDEFDLYDIPLQEIEMKAMDANVDIMSSGDEGFVVGKASIVSSTSSVSEEESTSITHIFVDPQFLYDKLAHAQRLKQSFEIDAALKILRSTFDNAIQDLDFVDEKYFKATTALMQHMRDAQKEWTAGNSLYDIPIDSIAKDRHLKPFLLQNYERIDALAQTPSGHPSYLKRNGR